MFVYRRVIQTSNFPGHWTANNHIRGGKKKNLKRLIANNSLLAGAIIFYQRIG